MRMMFLAGTRPEIIKLAPIYKILKLDTRFSRTIIDFFLTGQHGALAQQAAADMALDIDFQLELAPKALNLAQAYSDLYSRITHFVSEITPDLILVQGDTLSALAGAQCGFLQNIPVAHVEAGLRSGHFSTPHPEEQNRRLISTLASLHFAPTQSAAKALARENVNPKTIFVTGNTVIDALESVMNFGHNAFNDKTNHHKHILITCHRRENWGQGLDDLLGAVRNILTTHPNIEVIFPVHSNPHLMEQVKNSPDLPDGLRILGPLPYADFIQTLAQTDLIITDSGGVQEEAAYFNIPTLVMRKNTERTEGLSSGLVRLCSAQTDQLHQAALKLLETQKNKQINRNIYGDGRASLRIANALASWLQKQQPHSSIISGNIRNHEWKALH